MSIIQRVLDIIQRAFSKMPEGELEDFYNLQLTFLDKKKRSRAVQPQSLETSQLRNFQRDLEKTHDENYKHLTFNENLDYSLGRRKNGKENFI